MEANRSRTDFGLTSDCKKTLVPKGQISKLYVSFIPTVGASGKGVPCHSFDVDAEVDVPRPEVGDVVVFGEPGRRYRVASRTFAYPGSVNGSRALHLFYAIEPLGNFEAPDD